MAAESSLIRAESCRCGLMQPRSTSWGSKCKSRLGLRNSQRHWPAVELEFIDKNLARHVKLIVSYQCIQTSTVSKFTAWIENEERRKKKEAAVMTLETQRAS